MRNNSTSRSGLFNPRLLLALTSCSMAAFVIIPAPLASAYPRPGATERVSVASNGTQANVASSHAVISADGRHQAFTSAASNLVPGDTNAVADAFVRDPETGLTERVSVASD